MPMIPAAGEEHDGWLHARGVKVKGAAKADRSLKFCVTLRRRIEQEVKPRAA
jgi:hypothetical protein